MIATTTTTTCYRIETRNLRQPLHCEWDPYAVGGGDGEANRFSSRVEAEQAIDGLRALGLASALVVATRRVRHPGNHKYAWGLARSARRALPASLPYPKVGAVARAS
jgi:hypothetical protein